MAPTIYLHWAATPYTWVRQGLYHTIVAGDGRLHHLHAYSVDLNAHTYRRNSNSVGLCCACMGGVPDPWSIPPTPAQIEALCHETAAIARSWHWTPADITIQRVMTHAEAASNRDGRHLHDNYGPQIWGGTGERWDFLQLSADGPPTGGDQLRARIRELMAPQAPSPATALEFRGATTISARGHELAVQLDAHGSSWAFASELLHRYAIPFNWDFQRRRILIAATDVAPSYQADQVQPSVGWPLFEMSLQSGLGQVILRGILREHRAWCRVHEFAAEFGISTSYDPFTLGERRGG